VSKILCFTILLVLFYVELCTVVIHKAIIIVQSITAQFLETSLNSSSSCFDIYNAILRGYILSKR
jgi:hypothetical protein